MDLTPVEQRILGCLLEKQRTTPDGYPLTLNALRLACNQATNRDPVVDYDEATLRPSLERLSRARLIRFASGHGSRVAKYRHLADEALHLEHAEQAIIAVLLLRGPQTPGELKMRTDRLYGFADLEAVGATLTDLQDRGLVRDIGRRPGQKEDRWEHRLGEEDEGGTDPVITLADPPFTPAHAVAVTPPVTPPPAIITAPAPIPGGHEARIATLEAQVAELRAQVSRLITEQGGDPS
jgi:uncharacterized protein YceH (UPF0502 family)